MSDKKKLIVFVIIVLFTLVGGTYAYWTWVSGQQEETTVMFNATGSLSCSADGGGDITSNNVQMLPTNCTSSEHAIKRTITLSHPMVQGELLKLNMWLNVVNIDSNLKAIDTFKYALTTKSDSCTTGVIASGNFKNVNNGQTIPLLDNAIVLNAAPETYYLYIWIDREEEDRSIIGDTFHFTLGGNCTNNFPEAKQECLEPPTIPKLDSGMIPVTIADDGTVTAVSKNSSDWYSYCDKKWANAVLVTSTNRSTYQSIANGTAANATIPASDILAYFVWIPRYSYKIWTTGVSTNGEKHGIGIYFRNNNFIDRGTQVGEWYTHPAFTFGDEELDGIWVGKFATSTATTSSCYGSSPTVQNCDNTNQEPRVLPGVYSLSRQKVINKFITSLKFAGGEITDNIVSFSGSNIYGLTANADSHMMKNSDWGAVAYLSHSKYGQNADLQYNSSNAITGYRYGNTDYSYSYSTTGNISGVFDMAGGMSQVVMGYYGSRPSSIYDSYCSNTGIPSVWYSNNEKYYDFYNKTVLNDSITNCTLASCGGHALNETYGWYYNGNYFPDAGYCGAWFCRSGSYYQINAGAFLRFSSIGNSSVIYDDDSNSFRVTLILK